LDCPLGSRDVMYEVVARVDLGSYSSFIIGAAERLANVHDAPERAVGCAADRSAGLWVYPKAGGDLYVNGQWVPSRCPAIAGGCVLKLLWDARRRVLAWRLQEAEVARAVLPPGDFVLAASPFGLVSLALEIPRTKVLQLQIVAAHGEAVAVSCVTLGGEDVAERLVPRGKTASWLVERLPHCADEHLRLVGPRGELLNGGDELSCLFAAVDRAL